MPARRELQKSSREPTIAAAMVFEASVVREVLKIVSCSAYLSGTGSVNKAIQFNNYKNGLRGHCIIT